MRLPRFDIFLVLGALENNPFVKTGVNLRWWRTPMSLIVWGEIPILDWELIQSSWQDIDIIDIIVNACTDTVWLFLFEWWQPYLFDNYDIVMNQVSTMTIMFFYDHCPPYDDNVRTLHGTGIFTKPFITNEVMHVGKYSSPIRRVWCEDQNPCLVGL